MMRFALTFATVMVLATPALADSASCLKAAAALTKMPEVELLDDEKWLFAYRSGGAINLNCVFDVISIVIGTPLIPSPEFWSFFGRLARIVGTEPSAAIKAAQACLSTRHGFDTPTLHVGCRVYEKEHFISIDVARCSPVGDTCPTKRQP
jgi:hypothetical protein